MRADLHREYKHPTTGLVAKLKDIAKDFSLKPANAAMRLRKRIPLTDPPRRVKGVRKPKTPNKGPSASRLYNPEATVLGVNPMTGKAQNKWELAKALGITVEYARQRIVAGKTKTIKVYTEGEKLVKLTKKKAAQAEMNKLIAEMDARKAMLNV